MDFKWCTFQHVLRCLCNIGDGHARPPFTGDHVQSKALPPELANISARGDELDGAGNWNWSRDEVLKYGDLSQAAYDAFQVRGGPSSHRGTCRYGLRRLLPSLGLAGRGYVATAFLYATVDIVPGVARDDHRHWIGYVAVADDAERDRAGYRDIVVVWRGTVAPDEMFKDFEGRLVPMQGGEETELGTTRRPPPDRGAPDVRVERGFHSLYASSCDACKKHGNLSARSQVLHELRRLVTHFSTKHPDEKIRVTATGRSLGGALAVLTAWDAAEALSSGGDRVPVSAVTFGAPRVGNWAFRDELVASRGVSVLRVVVKQRIS